MVRIALDTHDVALGFYIYTESTCIYDSQVKLSYQYVS